MYLEITASKSSNSSRIFDGLRSMFDCQLLTLIYGRRAGLLLGDSLV